MSISEEARVGVARMIGFSPKLVYFLALGPLDEPRKNIQELVQTFVRVSASMPNARLIVKSSWSDAPQWGSHPQVIFLPLRMPFEYVSALYELSTVYVSAHHAEGWGLAISDAMLFEKPVIATNYSGNREYTTAENSFPLRFAEGEVADIPAPGIAVEPGMRWAKPDSEHLAELLLQLYASHGSADVKSKVRRASEDIRRFDRRAVADVIAQRIHEIAK
ncbi:glycosyltransferase [Xanthomonas nasturtii]|uniref:glycosyltransferase n=1 Tax=Xanthomonas nasturtii TaxID=1843581 RepID=UPI002B228367|nr:glycosyltransferase [Xanthomonas nasturtii]MEA9580414.1 glycosyltransferase [Xanthomonas nasturtii]